jgi:hypothetical protein
MGILVQPWTMLLFAVVMFFVFLALGAKERFKAVTPMTRWIIVRLCVAIATFGAFSVFKIH